MPEMVFDLPWRIYWTPGPAAPGELVKAVRRSRPLTLILNITGVDELGSLGLPWEGTSVTAVHHGWGAHHGPLSAFSVDRWEFPVEGLENANRIAAESFFEIPPTRCAFRWSARKGEMHLLPEWMGSAARLGCGLTLPNRTASVITTRGTDAFPDPREIDEATAGLMRQAAAVLNREDLKVHDYFLAKALNCETVESKGCEAANSIAFIDESGEVYPCESLKVALGNLYSMEMESIWSSSARGQIRKEIGSMPPVCRSCPDLPICRGGCRGAAYHLTGRHGDPDPLCPR